MMNPGVLFGVTDPVRPRPAAAPVVKPMVPRTPAPAPAPRPQGQGPGSRPNVRPRGLMSLRQPAAF